jgi:hypothetical protein
MALTDGRSGYLNISAHALQSFNEMSWIDLAWTSSRLVLVLTCCYTVMFRGLGA